jgi:hypothetical protein
LDDAMVASGARISRLTAMLAMVDLGQDVAGQISRGKSIIWARCTGSVYCGASDPIPRPGAAVPPGWTKQNSEGEAPPCDASGK